MSKSKAITVLTVILVLSSFPIHAQEIKLKSGKSMEGKLTKASGNKVTIRTSTGMVLSLPRDLVLFSSTD